MSTSIAGSCQPSRERRLPRSSVVTDGISSSPRLPVGPKKSRGNEGDACTGPLRLRPSSTPLPPARPTCAHIASTVPFTEPCGAAWWKMNSNARGRCASTLGTSSPRPRRRAERVFYGGRGELRNASRTQRARQDQTEQATRCPPHWPSRRRRCRTTPRRRRSSRAEESEEPRIRNRLDSSTMTGRLPVPPQIESRRDHQPAGVEEQHPCEDQQAKGLDEPIGGVARGRPV